MEKVYTIVHFYQDYEYPNDTNTRIVESYRKLEDAEARLKTYVDGEYNHGEDFDSEEDYQLFLKLGFCSPECFIDEKDDRYTCINIVENELK